MSYQYATIDYAGIPLDVFLTSDQQAWLTLTSLATGLGVHRQTVKNWINRESDFTDGTLAVKVGPRNTPASAYPVAIAVDFLKFLALKGNQEAEALLTASLVADLTRHCQ